MADLPSELRTALADRYLLERPLGRGGMATVYLARDLRHRRPVALKVLHPELALVLGPARFLREIEVAANLSHPHILPLFDSGEVVGQLYYVMPYVEGESLRDRLRRETQLPVDTALQLGREVADALAYAHRQGVIHRDIKPENILLSGGHALVADFGIARAVSQPGAERLTETGLAVGTAAYMSPEQASGGTVDGRSDIFSLGCVVYEMLAGEPPFTGPTVYALIAQRFNATVPRVRQLRPSVAPLIDEAVARALAPVAADRFATADQLALALVPLPAAALGGSRRTWLSRRLVRGRVLLASALSLGALIALVTLWVVRPDREAPGEGVAPKVVAVLPFESLGKVEDKDFSDAIADEVRGRLSRVPGIEVIARGSSMSYKETPKSQPQIARELGVEYLLTGTVQWGKGADGRSTVRVNPELVWIRGSGAPRTQWQESFDAPVNNTFAVYADIAGQVAKAVGVAFGDSVRQRLAERPTRETTAYDAYLRGEALSQSLATGNPTTLRQAVPYYAKAVALDSGFLQAWAQLSRAHSLLYFNSAPTPADKQAALLAAQRAVTLAPDRAEGHTAMGTYHYLVEKDYPRAEQEFALGRKAAASDADLLARSALAEMSLGEWDAALGNLAQAQRLDPRSVATASSMTWVLLCLRRYPEAGRAADRAIALAPADPGLLQTKAMVLIAQGDLAQARTVLSSAPAEVDRVALLTDFVHYFGLHWVLDEAQQQVVLGLTPRAFDDDSSAWALGLAQIYWERGNYTKGRVYADSACAAVQSQLRAEPNDAQRHELYGLCLAYLGRRNEAVREGQRAIALLPVAKNADMGAYLQHQLVRIYLLVGEPENALDQLEPLLSIPYYLSPGWLKVDPAFAPLRGNPRFERLLEG